MSLVGSLVVPYTTGEIGDHHHDVTNLDGTIRRLRGRLAREERPWPKNTPYEYGHEVNVTPGVCVTWGCQRTVFGWGDGNRECSDHRYEPFPKDERDRTTERERVRQRMANDPVYAAQVRERRRLATQKLRQDPAYRERHNSRRRTKRAEDPEYRAAINERDRGRYHRTQSQLATAGTS